MMDINAPRFIPVQEVMETLCISRATFHRWINDGKLKPLKIGNKTGLHSDEMDRVLTEGIE